MAGFYARWIFKTLNRAFFTQRRVSQRPRGDYAEFVGNQIGLQREDVKAVLNPALHGQTRGNLVGAEEWEKLQNRIKVEEFLKRDLPGRLGDD
jgi:hypothetical protein